MVGADSNEDLYKGPVCFMIIGLKSGTPYILKTFPEKEIRGEWLKMLRYLNVLQETGVNVCGVHAVFMPVTSLFISATFQPLSGVIEGCHVFREYNQSEKFDEKRL